MRSKKKIAAAAAAEAAMLISSLPEDMQEEIFLKLPVKSILTCKCVCKPWLNLISSPNDHLKLSIQNKNNHKLMFTDKEWITGKPLMYSIDCASTSSSLDLSCEDIGKKAVLMDTPFEYKKGTEVRILGACNGLVCLGIISNEGTSNICIWNPTTREYKEHVDFPINLRHPPIAWLSWVGFGYNGQTGDYKMVRITTYYGKRDSCEVQVYTFGSHSSRIIHAFPYKFPGDLTFQGVLLNALHWTSDASNSIVSFDISNEKFRDVPLPENSIIHPEGGNLNKKLGVLEDCLCLVLVNNILVRAEVWVMRGYGVGESWTKLFTTTQYPGTSYLHWTPLLSLKNGDILMHTYSGFVLCNPKNERVGELSKFFQSNTLTPQSYVESLVSLNSGTYVKKPKRQKSRVVGSRYSVAGGARRAGGSGNRARPERRFNGNSYRRVIVHRYR